MDKLGIGQQYKQARLEEGLSQNQLAKRAGVTKATISDFEAGKRNATEEMLIKLAEALNRQITDKLLIPKV